MAVTNGNGQLQTSFLDVENLKTLIRNVAKTQTHDILSGQPIRKRKIDVERIAEDLLQSGAFDTLNAKLVRQEVTGLTNFLDEIYKDGVLVRDGGIGDKWVPVPYEVLHAIFSQTSEKFRQRHFQELMAYYYNELSQTALTRSEFEIQAKTTIRVVKLEVLASLLGSCDERELIANVTQYFKNPRLNVEDVYVVVSNYLSSSHFEFQSFDLVPLDERNGHLGDYFDLLIDIKGHQQLNVFAKFLTPKLSFLKEFVRTGPSKKEDFFYKVFLPEIAEVASPELITFAPCCYLSRLNDVIILENMKNSGFIGLTPNKKLRLDALKLAVGQLAHLHACSLIYEERRSVKMIDVYGEFLHEVLFDPDSEVVKMSYDAFIGNIKFLFSEFSEMLTSYSPEEVDQMIRRGWDLMLEKVKPSRRFRNVICHGDVYVANMLFKFEEEACAAVKLIDFQILRYCPPAQDLMFFIYQNSYKETVDEHLSEILDEYYNTLTKDISKHGLNMQDIISRAEFDESTLYMKSEAVFHALFYSPLQCIDPKTREAIFQDADLNAKRKDDPLMMIKIGLKDDEYRRVMRGLLSHVIDLCDNGELS